jgi:hypothetical protein
MPLSSSFAVSGLIVFGSFTSLAAKIGALITPVHSGPQGARAQKLRLGLQPACNPNRAALTRRSLQCTSWRARAGTET